MSLTNLLLLIKGEDGEVTKHIDMIFDNRGVIIACDEGEEMTAHETHYALGVAFIHAGAQLKETVLDPNDPAYLGYKLYAAFHGSYKGIKSIREMTLEDFNKYMTDHDL